MKKTIGTLTVILVIILTFAIPASAAVYEKTFTKPLIDVISERASDSNGTVAFTVQGSFMGLGPSAGSAAQMPNGTTGYVFSFIAVHGIEARSAQDTVIENNIVECYTSLQWSNFATKSNHYATRTGYGISNSWDYTFIDPEHDPNETLKEVIDVVKQ